MASEVDVVNALRECAEAWEPDVCVLGNVQARDVVAVCERLRAAEAERDKYARLHSEAEAQIECRNELRYRLRESEAALAQVRAQVDTMIATHDEVEKREKDHRPRYRDCAGSRDPVKAAKLVLGIYRPEVYDENADPREGQIGVLKNNQGKSPGWKRHVAVRLDLETHTIRDASDDLGRRRMEAV